MSWKRVGTLFTSILAAVLFCSATRVTVADGGPYPVNPDVLQALRWRSIGPTRGGRAPAVAGDPKNPLIFYFGTEGGGVWKTYDAGRYWQNISDPYFKTSSIGAIAVAPSDPSVIYVGTGEAAQHVDIQSGDGVYKSTDAGKTWVNVGLASTRHIAKIVISPTDPNLVYVAAFGHEFETNPDRGVYRSKDGGKTWQKILFVSDRAGAVDLSMDPTNPQVIYASIYQFLRQPWSEISGGPDSGLYKTTDGGDHWTNISRYPGLPKGVLGKIGVSICASRPSRVYAVIEADHGGLFRSDDSGATWQLVNNDRVYRYMAYWYMHVIADPQNPDVVYIPDVQMFKSTDGGHTLHEIPFQHSDHHALWIDPTNDKRMIEGDDGGAVVTLTGGDSWSTEYNQPTAEYFKLAVDNQYPFRVYATQMDSGAVSCPSQTLGPAIEWKDCYTVGSAESGFIAPRLDDPDIVFAGAIGSSQGGGGNLYEYDHRTGQQRMITVWPEDQYQSPVIDVKYRFYFTFPVVLSPHDPNVLYVAAQYVFRSTDMGSSWQKISPDLTRDDKSHMMHIDGGPITWQQLSSQYTSTIYSFAESPLKAGELWAGSDDGSVHFSPDDGKTWLDRSPKDLPEWTGIYSIEVSPHTPGTVYIAANRHELSDHTPYFEKTTDYGKTWQRIDDGIPMGDYAWVVREDPVRTGLLFAGTEGGTFVSFDDGAHWQSIRRNMPVVSVRDLRVTDNDLVAATHGRAFWILDNIGPLRQVTPDLDNFSAHLFTIPLTYRSMSQGFGGRSADLDKHGPAYVQISGDGIGLHLTREADGSVSPTYLNAGMNPPRGVVVTYYLKDQPRRPVTLTFLDSEGKTIKQFTSEAGPGPKAPAEVGTNRFVWDMTYPNAKELPRGRFAAVEWGSARAPVAVPGTYSVRLNVDGQSFVQPFTVREDPRVKVSVQDLQAEFGLMIEIRDEITAVTEAVDRIEKARNEIATAAKQASGRPGVKESAEKIDAQLLGIEGHLTRMLNPEYPMKVPPKTVNIRLAELTTVVQSADAAPTKQSYQVFDVLSGQASEQFKKLEPILQSELPDFLAKAGVSGTGGKT